MSPGTGVAAEQGVLAAGNTGRWRPRGSDSGTQGKGSQRGVTKQHRKIGTKGERVSAWPGVTGQVLLRFWGLPERLSVCDMVHLDNIPMFCLPCQPYWRDIEIKWRIDRKYISENVILYLCKPLMLKKGIILT